MGRVKLFVQGSFVRFVEDELFKTDSPKTFQDSALKITDEKDRFGQNAGNCGVFPSVWHLIAVTGPQVKPKANKPSTVLKIMPLVR